MEKDKSQDTIDCRSNEVGHADGLARAQSHSNMLADKVAKSLGEKLLAIESTVNQIGEKADTMEDIVESD